MAGEPWAGTLSLRTVNATSSAAGDDGFAKSATQTLATPNIAKVVRKDLGARLPVSPSVLSPSSAVDTWNLKASHHLRGLSFGLA